MSIVIKKGNENSLSWYIPYLEFDHNQIFFKNKAAALVLSLGFIYDDAYSIPEINYQKTGLNTFFNSLETNLYVQFIFKKSDYADDIIDSHLALNHSQEPLVKSLFVQRTTKINQDRDAKQLFRFYLYLVIKKEYIFSSSSDEASFLEAPAELSDKLTRNYLDIQNDLSDIQSRYLPLLKKCGFAVRIPTEDEVIALCASQINLEEKRNVKYNGDPQDLVFTCFDITHNYFFASDQYARVVTFKQRHPILSTQSLRIKALLNAGLAFHYDVIVNIQKTDKQVEVRKLRLQKRWNHSMKMDLATGGASVNENYDLQEKETSEMLYEIAGGSQQLFNYEIMILVKADSYQELKKNCDLLAGAITEIDNAQGYKESIANFQLFQSSWPGNMTLKNKRNFKLKTDNLTDLLPIYGPPPSIGEALLLLRNHYDSITYYNPFSTRYKNRNGFIIGSSGAGKSFFMNLLLLSYMSQNPEIVIVDIGGSYEKYVGHFGGQYFKVSPQYHINPFDIPTKNWKRFWKAILQTMIKGDREKITTDEKIIIEEAIEIIQGKQIGKPIVSDFVTAIREMEYTDAELKQVKDRVIRYLERWTRGDLGDFCNNREGNLKIENRICGFDLKGLEEHEELIEVFMIWLSALCWHKAESNREVPKVYVFDEAWEHLMRQQAGLLIMGLYRTIRKYGGAVFTISQDVTDLSQSKHRAAIMANIEFFYVLQQSKTSDLGTLQQVLNLSDTEMEQIQRIESVKGLYSEAYVKTPDAMFLGRIVPSGYEYWVATTDNEDFVLFRDTMARYKGDLLKTLADLAENYPHGASYGA